MKSSFASVARFKPLWLAGATVVSLALNHIPFACAGSRTAGVTEASEAGAQGQPAVVTPGGSINPVLVGGRTGVVSVVTVSGTHAYVGSDANGLEIIDVSNPATPTRVGGWSGYPVCSIVVSGRYAYLATREAGLQIIDVSNPAAPAPVGSWGGGFGPPGFAYGVAVSGNYAYVVDLLWLEVIDVSNPTAPVLASRCGPPRSPPPWCDLVPQAVAASGAFAHVTWGVRSQSSYYDSSTLDVLNASQPAAPAWAGSLELNGLARSVALGGQYAYLAAGSAGLAVVDVGDAARPVRVGGVVTVGQAKGVAVSGDYAYVAEGTNGLEVIDVSNATTPTRVGGCPISGSASGVAVSGDYAYVAAGEGGLVILRIPRTVPGTAPTITTAPAGRRVVAGSSVTLSVSASGTMPLAYQWRKDGVERAGATNSSLGLLSAQASDAGSYTVIVSNAYGAVTSTPPAVLTVVPAVRLTLAGTWSAVASAVTVREGYAYVGSGTNSLEIIDVSNPAAPVWVGGVVTGGRGNQVAAAGNYAYLADGANGLRVIDVSNPAAPTRLGGLALDGASAVAVSNAYAYVGTFSGLKVVDVSHSLAPNLVCDWPGPGAPFRGFENVALSGRRAYVTCYFVDPMFHRAVATLGVLDLANLAGPAWVGSWSGASSEYSPPLGLAVSGRYAYVTDGVSGLKVVDVGDAPREVGSLAYPPDACPRGVAVSGSRVYVADGANGLRVIDVSQPAAPLQVGMFRTGAPAVGVAVVGGHAYVATDAGGLVILRMVITDSPGWTPVRLAATSLSGGRFQFEITGDLGPSYVLQASTTLTDWVNVWTNRPTTMPIAYMDPEAGAFGSRYYRVLLGP